MKIDTCWSTKHILTSVMDWKRILFSTPINRQGINNTQYQTLGDVQQMSTQHQYMDIAEFRGVSQHSVLFTVRRTVNNRTVSDLTVPFDLQHA
ncbi:MAG: hypothetical protein ACKPKO_16420 [Candidatus Fonsibacter sp.]